MTNIRIKLALIELMLMIFLANRQLLCRMSDERLQFGIVRSGFIGCPSHCLTISSVIEETWGLVHNSSLGAGLMPCPEEDLLLLFSIRHECLLERPPFVSHRFPTRIAQYKNEGQHGGLTGSP